MSIRRDFGLLWCLLGGLLWPALSLSTPVHYRMFELGEHPAPAVDDAVWTRAHSVTLEGLGANLPLKAPATMKAVYKEGTPDRIYVRWEKTLADQAWVDVAPDSPAIGSHTASVFYIKADDLTRVLNEQTWVLGASPHPDHPDYYDATWPGGVFSTASNLSNVDVTASVSGNRRRIQLAFDAPMALSEGQQFLCGFRDNERITGGILTHQYAFNVDPTLGHLGLCEAAKAPFYLAPAASGGSDSHLCTSAQPCLISKLASSSEPRPSPGETWILKDGEYPIGTHINCASGSSNGTSALPITVKAENERLAWIRSNSGSEAFLKISNCAHWNFEGLRIGANSDATTATGYLFEAHATSNIGFRKNLIHHGARISNNANVLFWHGNGGHVIEDNECYYAKRYCFLIKYEHVKSTFRRNAGSFRTYPDVAGQTEASQNKFRNDVFIGVYPGSNMLLEDNYSELNWTGYNSEAGNSQHTDNNKAYGNISLNDHYGTKFAPHALTELVRNWIVRDFLAVDASRIPVSLQSQVNAVISHFSLFSTMIPGASVIGSMTNGVNPSDLSMRVTDGIIVGAPGKPAWHISVTGPNPVYDDWRIDRVWRYGNTSANSPATHAKITNITTAASSPFGSTRVCVPSTLTNIKGKASDGGDPGANVLYRYENGVKDTTKQKKRWVTTKPASCPANTSGIYPYNIGACVSGLNDTVSDSFVGYADRLGMTIDQVETTCGEGASYFP